ncbi:hypothetical protein D7B24_009601 [Verticillium nonalfalfae]|uniref:Uncharacterized protein n=1 Tax=Verticillium nonalfalfae TaxID=1051616 RepID=A0A3M9Y477_9PEZI|nr:uncharacterized protein D7B24_009601 [Verticillium nonalfalfae]RNJ54586.1 hypothetical protein D7B24_009601 [Verticillium nonalfalfae]
MTPSEYEKLKVSERNPRTPYSSLKSGRSHQAVRLPTTVSSESSHSAQKAHTLQETPLHIVAKRTQCLITPPNSLSPSSSPVLSTIQVYPEPGQHLDAADFNAKLRAAIGLPNLPKCDIEIFLRSLDGFDDKIHVSRIFTPQQQHAIEVAFGFPTCPLVLSHDSREQAVSVAQKRLHEYLVAMFRAAVECVAYYPGPSDDGYEERRHDEAYVDERMCDFFAMIGSNINSRHREDPAWVVGYGLSALSGDAKRALFEGVLHSFRTTEKHEAVWTELAVAVGKWEEVWWIKMKWF